MEEQDNTVSQSQPISAPTRAAREAEEPAAWRPIETAPKGEVVILYWPETPTLFARVSINMASDHGPHRAPTHWMPLPPPPAPTSDSKHSEGGEPS